MKTKPLSPHHKLRSAKKNPKANVAGKPKPDYQTPGSGEPPYEPEDHLSSGAHALLDEAHYDSGQATFTMSSEEIQALQYHPIAELLPMMEEDEIDEIADSMAATGKQRDPIVLFDGKILDGRNTLKAAIRANLDPKFREFNPETEGDPAVYVLDKNLRRRHIGDATQRAAIFSAGLKFIDAKYTIGEEAKLANVSRRTMSDVKAGEEAGFADQMQAGEMSASAAAARARDKKPGGGGKKKAGKKEQKEEDNSDLREEHGTKLGKLHGEQFGRAFEAGTILKKRKDIKAFVELEPAAQKDIVPYLAEGWDLQRAIAFHNGNPGLDDDIRGLTLRAASAGKAGFTCTVAGYKITVKKAD